MTIELAQHQRELLTELLAREHKDREHELYRTDSLSYKKLLRERISVIEDLCERLAIVETVG